jgi:hypothetical protein
LVGKSFCTASLSRLDVPCYLLLPLIPFSLLTADFPNFLSSSCLLLLMFTRILLLLLKHVQQHKLLCQAGA